MDLIFSIIKVEHIKYKLTMTLSVKEHRTIRLKVHKPTWNTYNGN